VKGWLTRATEGLVYIFFCINIFYSIEQKTIEPQATRLFLARSYYKINKYNINIKMTKHEQEYVKLQRLCGGGAEARIL
jgi:hypothetical protein